MARLLIPGLRAYRVRDRFFAGSYPGGQTEEEARERINALRRLGVSVFINLMEDGEHRRYGATMQEYDALFPAATRAHDTIEEDKRSDLADSEKSPDAHDTHDSSPHMIRFPIRDMGVPECSSMRRILDAIDRHVERGESVYLHCLGGVGRTGTVVGCWLSRHGIAEGAAALHEIDRLREFDPTLDLPSPQTEEQRRMVRSWGVGE